ncbi:oxidoreductase [Chitinimonas prasina]|uniref:Oxidoreductase n=1 Tax=Chitinimonas prasina TaxID=1434937 RepID=A0ABQ5Y8Y5_9NEIS|nr:ferredoxin reductase [Chitinimonas prasina]GLR11400.1 oxidoreductase [Chitinimonas prasina]
MPLIPAALVNLALPLTRPLAAFLREDVFDYYGRLLHPQLQLRRVFARLKARRLEGEATVVLTLSPSRNWRGFRAGQHVAVTLEKDGVRHTRRYSPMRAANGRIEIAIKRLKEGLVSSLLHEEADSIGYLEIGQAEGDFVLPDTLPPRLLFLAAGSGITPILAMLRELKARGYQGELNLLYYGRHRNQMAYLDELRAYPGLHLHVCLTGEQAQAGEQAGRFSAAQLDALVPKAEGSAVFACGSHGFTEAVQAVWQQRGWQGLACESFTPPTWHLEDDKPVTLTFARARRQLAGRTGGTLLEQAEAHGLKPASGCRMGICNTCTCQKREGAVRDLRTGEISTKPDETIRLCITAPVGNVVLDL